MKNERVFELLLIGGGPAGLAAGIYAARDGLNCLLFERGAVGGQILRAPEIANCPGFASFPSGPDLAEMFGKHAGRFGLKVRDEEVGGLRREGDVTRVVTDGGAYLTRTAIIASGSSHRTLGVPGEERLHGRGVSYCGSCDGPLFRDKRVVVVGGGDTAMEEALFISRFASRVIIVHRRDRLRACRYLQERVLSHRGIEFAWNSEVKEILGENAVAAVRVESTIDGKKGEIQCDGVFIFIGIRPNSDFLKGVLDLDETGYVITDIHMRTSLPGVFAAGDVRRDSVRQIASAVGDGVTAVIQAERYLSLEMR